MSRTSIDVEVNAPPEEVWKVVADPRNLPQWDRHITAVDGLPQDGLKEGAVYTTRLRMMGVEGRVEVEVLEIDPPKRARIRLRGLLYATVETRLTPISGGKRTLLEQDVDFSIRGGRLASLATKGLELTGGPDLVLRRGVLAQKRQIESAR